VHKINYLIKKKNIRKVRSYIFIKMPGAKNYFLTFFNKQEVDDLKTDIFIYLLICSEICPSTKREHWHAGVKFKSTREFSVMKKLYPTCNIQEKSKYSTWEQLQTYCKKDGKFEEFGTLPKNEQGKRNDLNKIKDSILEGEESVDDILTNNPILYHQYGRTLEKIEDQRMRKLFRTEMTLGFWLWGDTGSGKSHTAYKNFHPDTHYVLNINDKGWWEGYKQQETVIINEFRGQIAYSELLDLVDKWPKSVPRRGKEPLPFTSKRVIITTSLPPDEVYHNLSIKDSLKQLYRRFKIIRVRSGQEVILDS